jgi:hypothetical protein
MFLNSEDISDDEDVGNSDIVVPLSLVASTPQIINGSSRANGHRSALEAEDPPSGRSNQYNERLARARALNEQKRRVSSSSGARRESWVRARLGGVGESVRCGQRIGGAGGRGVRTERLGWGVSAQPATTAGMVVANVDHFQRPAAASMASIDVLSQEVEEMELEEAQSHQAVYQQVRAATAPPAQPHPTAVPPLRCAVRVCSLRWCKSAW